MNTRGFATRKSRSPEYRTWVAIKQRCCNPKDKSFPRYGGRGIAVCDRWAESFDAFLSDMGLRPGPGYSIERKNNDGDYSEDNCRWATVLDQANNTRRSRFIEFRGESATIAQWARRLGFHRITLRNRLMRMPAEEALTLPTQPARWTSESAITASAKRTLTPKQRSAIASNAARVGHEKRREAGIE